MTPMDWLSVAVALIMIVIGAVMIPRVGPASRAAADNPVGARAYRMIMLGCLAGGLGLLGMSAGRHLMAGLPALVALAAAAFLLMMAGGAVAAWGIVQLVREQARTGWAFDPFGRSR